MSIFELYDAGNKLPDEARTYLDGAEPPEYCTCSGHGPWNVTVTISGTLEQAGIGVAHVDCGRPMELPEWMDVSAEDVPMRLSVASTTDRGPDDDSWFELTPPAETENVQQLADVVDRIRNIGRRP